MNTIYLIGIVVIGIAVTLKLFYSVYKRDSASKKQIHYMSSVEEYETDLKTSIERFGEIERPELSQENKWLHSADGLEEMERPQMSRKNKWLYPTDGFRKMEHGVVDDESKGTDKGKKKVLRLRKIEKE